MIYHIKLTHFITIYNIIIKPNHNTTNHHTTINFNQPNQIHYLKSNYNNYYKYYQSDNHYCSC